MGREYPFLSRSQGGKGRALGGRGSFFFCLPRNRDASDASCFLRLQARWGPLAYGSLGEKALREVVSKSRDREGERGGQEGMRSAQYERGRHVSVSQTTYMALGSLASLPALVPHGPCFDSSPVASEVSRPSCHALSLSPSHSFRAGPNPRIGLERRAFRLARLSIASSIMRRQSGTMTTL